MSKTNKTRTYDVHVRIDVLTDITVSAASLSAAIDQVNAMNLHDVIDLPGDWIDGPGFTVKGVFEIE